jgi:hypothetical protein
MKLSEIAQNIQPLLTVKERDLLKRAHKIHEDPNLHTHPEQQRLITRLMKMGLLRMFHDPNVHYEVREKGKELSQ